MTGGLDDAQPRDLRALLADRDQMAAIAEQVVASGVGMIDTAAAAALGQALLAACPFTAEGERDA